MRYVILSPNLLEILREWWRVARKKAFLPLPCSTRMTSGHYRYR